MKRFGKPIMQIVVWGDWYTVISVREYRDQLIDQKPLDEVHADFHEYRIDCTTTKELLAACSSFRDAKLKVAVRIMFDHSADGVKVSAFMQSGDGYSNDGPFASVEMTDDGERKANAMKLAIATLKEGLK